MNRKLKLSPDGIRHIALVAGHSYNRAASDQGRMNAVLVIYLCETLLEARLPIPDEVRTKFPKSMFSEQLTWPPFPLPDSATPVTAAPGPSTAKSPFKPTSKVKVSVPPAGTKPPRYVPSAQRRKRPSSATISDSLKDIRSWFGPLISPDESKPKED